MSLGLDLRIRLVELHRQRVGLSVEELWFRYFALGGMRMRGELQALLSGRAGLASQHEYNLIAHAMNECFVERHLDQFIPYIDHESHLREVWP